MMNSLSPALMMSPPQHSPPLGNIQAIIGPMFSGKSTELLRRMRRHTIAKNSCALLKYCKDTRYSAECVSTHDQQQMKAISSATLMPIVDQLTDTSVVGIDEGQFFPDVVEFCELMANQGKTVIVAALDGDFLRRPFGQIAELIPHAEHVLKLNAVCFNCSRDAAFSKRIAGGDEVEVIGGADKYVAACRQCFFLCNSDDSDPRAPTPVAAKTLGKEDKTKQNGSTVDIENSTDSVVINRELFK
eukprot:m.166627 g.166627  ORF g.166627 m.166627 type:complete len:244 (-) comp31435_c1_seq1:891-1622(-)